MTNGSGPTPEQQAQQQKLIDAMNRAQEKNAALGREALTVIEAEIAARQELAKLAQKELSDNQQTIRDNKRVIDQYQRMLDDGSGLNDIQQDRLDKLKEENGLLADNVKKIEDAVDAEADLLKAVEARGAALQDIEASGANILQGTLGIGEAWKDATFAGKLYKGMEAGNSFGQSLGALGKGMADTFKVSNILGSGLTRVFTSTLEMVMATDSSLASFNKATGFAGEYNQEISAASAGAAKFGASMVATGEAAAGLAGNLATFTTMSKAARTDMIALTAGLANVGINADLSGKIMNDMMLGMKMTDTEAKQLTLDLAAQGKAMGYVGGAAKYAQDFQTHMKELAKYGEDGRKVFEGLAATSKAAGVEMDELMNVAGKFDTIEGAAEAAGNLNAILGGNLFNSMELLNATEEERIALLQRGLKESGRSWQSLGRHEQQAIALEAGFSSVAEAQKTFTMSTERYADAANSIAGVTGSHDQLAEATSASVSIGEKWAIILQRLSVMVLPIVNGISWLLDLVTEFGAVGSWVFFIVLPLAIKGLMMLFGGLFTSLGTWMGTIFPSLVTTTTTSVTGAAAPIAGAISTVGTAATAAAPGLYALGFAILALGVGIFLLVYGIVLLAQAMKGLTGAEFAMLSVILIAIGVGLYFAIPALLGFGAAAVASAPGLYAFGGAMLMIGGAILLAGLGLYLVAMAMVMIGNNAGAVSLGALALGVLAIALWFLTPALSAFGAVAAVVATPVLILALAFLVLGAGVALAGVGIYMIALGLSLLVDHVGAVFSLAFAFMTLVVAFAGVIVVAIPLFIALTLIAAGLILLATGLSTLAVPMLIFSLSLFVMGAAVNLMALGFSLFTASLMILVENAGGIFTLGAALLLLGGAAFILAIFGILASVGLLAMAVGLSAIALSLAFIKTADLIALGNVFTGLGMAMKGGGLAAAAGHVGDLIDVLDDGSSVLLSTIPLLAMLGWSFITFGGDIGVANVALGTMQTILMVLAPLMDWFVAIFDHFSFAVLPQFFAMMPQWWELLIVWALLVPVAFALMSILYMFAILAIPMAYAFTILAAALLLVAFAINAMNMVAVDALANLFLSISKAMLAMTGMYGLFYGLGSAIRGVAYATWIIDESATEGLATMFHELAEAAPVLAQPEAPENLEKIVRALNSVETSWIDAAIGGVTDVVGGIFESVGLGGTTKTKAAAGAGTVAAGTTIILKLDEREFGRAVAKALNATNDMSLG